MTRKTAVWAGIAVFCLIAFGWGVPTIADDAKAEAHGHAPEMTPEMEMWMKLAAPSEHHQHLAQMVGTWKTAATFWMEPGAPPMKTTGTVTNAMILDGRFLQSVYTGDFMGEAFKGIGIDGYDNYTKKHTGSWMDNHGTMVMNFEGDCEQSGNVRTMHSEYKDPLTGQPVKIKAVTTILGPDKYKYESWETKQGAEPHKGMEIVFTKQS